MTSGTRCREPDRPQQRAARLPTGPQTQLRRNGFAIMMVSRHARMVQRNPEAGLLANVLAEQQKRLTYVHDDRAAPATLNAS